MKLKTIRSEQFAGINDIDIELSDGINLILGDNETGKSTVVDLIYQTLFKSQGLDRRRDKGFIEKYFPAPSVKGVKGDCIDGTIIFEGSDGQYKLSREWDARGGNTSGLVLPDKTRLKGAEGIEEVLNRELVYGQGVYNEVVFASQEREYAALRHLMEDGVPKGIGEGSLMNELRSSVARAMMETGGVDVSELEGAIEAKIEEYGSNWDDSTPEGEPVGGTRHGISNPWKRQVGKVLAAYYERERIKKELRTIAEAERELEEASKRQGLAVEEARKARQRSESFAKYQSALSSKRLLERSISEESGNLKRLKAALPEWENDEKKLNSLQERFNKAKTGKVKEEDYENAIELENRIQTLKRRAGGLELLAGVELAEGYEISVRSAIDGRKIEPRDGRYEIEEAVKIKIPDVMQLTLSASDIDIDGMNAELSKADKELRAIYRHYRADGIETLRKKYKENNRLCQDLEGQLSELNASVAFYEKNYKSRDVLKADIDSRQERLEGLFKELDALPGVPEEYGRIEDIDGEVERLKEALADAEDEVRRISEELIEARSALGGKSQEEYEEELISAQERFEECRTTYRHWLHIMEVFTELKNKNNTSDTNDIAENFKKYLSLLTDDGIKLAEMDGELRQVSIVSRDNYINYAHLSEGSKDTVSLAFRLSVLEHLFPEGGAVAVFDDPFTDMDETRRLKACELIRKFSEKNQVLFVSCSPVYKELLGGKVIAL